MSSSNFGQMLLPRFRHMFRSHRDCYTTLRVLPDSSKLTDHNNLILQYNVIPYEVGYGNDSRYTSTEI